MHFAWLQRATYAIFKIIRVLFCYTDKYMELCPGKELIHEDHLQYHAGAEGCSRHHFT